MHLPMFYCEQIKFNFFVNVLMQNVYYALVETSATLECTTYECRTKSVHSDAFCQYISMPDFKYLRSCEIWLNNK